MSDETLRELQRTWDQLRNRAIGHACPWCEPSVDVSCRTDSIGELHREGCVWLTMDRLMQKSKGRLAIG